MRNPLSRFSIIAVLVMAACSSDDSPGAATPDGGSGIDKDASTLPSCDSLCPAVLAAKCTNGPTSQDDCVSGCKSIRMSPCADKYMALYVCGGANPVYTCDSNGRSIVVGCEAASAALYACAGGAM